MPMIHKYYHTAPKSTRQDASQPRIQSSSGVRGSRLYSVWNNGSAQVLLRCWYVHL